MRDLQWGSKGEDVQDLQRRLVALGYVVQVDGIFGSRTRAAVIRFQQDNGLAADGIVGPKTRAALGIDDGASQPGQEGTGKRRLVSLHLGLNGVDPNQYEGWDGKLNGCENDANTMNHIAGAQGFESSQLFTRNATADNVLSAIASVAGSLTAGDAFLLTYAGHGGQVPNVNGDVEEDQQDETWVLWDRMLIDDELQVAFAGFSSGVDIIVFSDSCHSGTVTRGLYGQSQVDHAERKQLFYSEVAASGDARDAGFPTPVAVAGARSVAVAKDQAKSANAMAAWSKMLRYGYGWNGTPNRSSLRRDISLNRVSGPVSVNARRFPGQGTRGNSRDSLSAKNRIVTTREMPLAVNQLVVVKHSALYSRLQSSARSGRAGPVKANGLLMSGCQDSQLSQEVGGNGVFTTTLKSVWNNGLFTGSYIDFHRQIRGRMGPTQTPELLAFGADQTTLPNKTPFS